MRGRPDNENEPLGSVEQDTNAEQTKVVCKKRKKVRRSTRRKTENEVINIVYSNIQGVTKKKESLLHIMNELQCVICLLAETLTKYLDLKGCRCITPIKSVGQNVIIVLRNKLFEVNRHQYQVRAITIQLE